MTARNATFERLSDFATISRHEEILAISAELIESKSLDAKANARKREMFVLHRDGQDPLQRMLNALQPGSYIRPHRHVTPPKSESVVLLSGSIGFVLFGDDGTPDCENFVLLHRSHGALAVDYRGTGWHTFFALEPNTVVFEAKAGPYNSATDKEFAAWAPAENSPEAQPYLVSLEHLFRQRFPDVR